MVSLIGQSQANMSTQLTNAKNRLSDKYAIELHGAKNWSELFEGIKNYHQTIKNGCEHFVLFIDELPWIATTKRVLNSFCCSIW